MSGIPKVGFFVSSADVVESCHFVAENFRRRPAVLVIIIRSPAQSRERTRAVTGRYVGPLSFVRGSVLARVIAGCLFGSSFAGLGVLDG